MPKRVFTPAAVKIIREMAAQDTPAAEIAAAVGSTTASVRVKCCQLKIPLRRRGHPSLVPTWPERERLVVYIHSAGYAALVRQAADMQKPAGELAAMLLQAIVSDNSFNAVLDQHG